MKLTLIFLVTVFALVQAEPANREQGNTNQTPQGRCCCDWVLLDCLHPYIPPYLLPYYCRTRNEQTTCCNNSRDPTNQNCDTKNDCGCSHGCTRDTENCDTQDRGTVNANTVHQAQIHNQDCNCQPTDNRETGTGDNGDDCCN